MRQWLTVNQMSARHDVEEATLKCWANLGYITSSRIDNQLFLDEKSFITYLEAHKRVGLQQDYLEKILEEKKIERDLIISRYDDSLYVLRSLKACEPLFEIVIQELAMTIANSSNRDIFYSISIGEPIERVAERHIATYDEILWKYDSILEEMNQRRNLPDIFQKQTIESTSRHALERNKRKIALESKVFNTPIHLVAEKRLVRALRLDNVYTVGQLLEQVKKTGWYRLKEYRNVGKASFLYLLRNLKQIGVENEELDEILNVFPKQK